ncbi:LysR family transcriptional regulator [Halioxenophilus aromaticivorans]|uniref:LysR family transcriptional regulator n=1 Tax=Halioxenophilus aromaticivorans TaxID=1306992 RepID=A0AAV3U1T2_9ALTE
MDLKTLAQIDLNLLVVLQVMLEEGSVSGAAKRLFLTQSAVSKALGRLRDQFDDPLFTRTSNGMVPTPKALQLKERLPAVLTAMQGLITPDIFHPEKTKAVIRVAMGEHAGILLLPPLIELLQRHAPGVKLQALNRVEHQLDRLATGELDFAIHMQHQRYPAEFKPAQLFKTSQGLMVREGHPLVGRRPEDVDMKQLKFVRLILPDANELEFLANIDVAKRHIAEANTVFETSHVASAVEVVRRTNCVLPIPEVLSLDAMITRGTTWLQFNPFGDFSINYALVSHLRTESSPLHRWVAEQIQTVTARIIGT